MWNRGLIDTKRLEGEKDRPDRPTVYPIVIYEIVPVIRVGERSDDQYIGVEYILDLERP